MVFQWAIKSIKQELSGTNETRHIEWQETCKCESIFGVNVCNNKQRWNNDKCRCEWKELIDSGVCDKGFIWYPSNVSGNVTNRVVLVNIKTMKIVGAEKN